MKPVLEHLPREKDESLVVKFFDYPYYPTPWHYHPEYEIVLVTSSTGKRFVGDSISDFGPGNLALLGPNLPHTYRNEERYYDRRSRLRAQSIVVHFLTTSLGPHFFDLPEALPIRQLLSRSVRGLDFFGNTSRNAAVQLHELVTLQGMPRLIKLLEILHQLSLSEDVRFISNAAIHGENEKESDRMTKVLEFVMSNFSREIRISEVAALVNLADNSFSRYFSQRTRKSFIAFVNEVRLNHASKLLIENTMSVSEVCFECGFNNLSHFNRHFKNLYGINPVAYRKQYLKKDI